MKRANRIAKKALIISIITISVSLLTIAWTIIRDSQIKKDTYKQNAEVFKPEIEIVKINFIGKPIIDSIPQNSKTDKDGMPIIESQIDVIAQFYITNKSKHSCIIVGKLFTDRISGSDFMRYQLSEKDELKNLKLTDKNDFFKITEIKANDTVIIENTYRLQKIQKDEFVLHFMILYENELEQLYDTYYWAQCKLNELTIRTYFDSIKNKFIIQAQKEQLEKMVELVEQNSHSKPYTKKERRKLIKTIKRIQNAS